MQTKIYDIALISCVKKKKDCDCMAKDMYTSDLFKKMYDYAKKRAKKIFILSAKYGLLREDDIISPYQKTLKDMSAHERKVWSYKVLQELNRECDISNDNFLILAGKKYREYICQKIKNYEIPLEGLGIGEQLSYLKNIR